MRGGSRPSVTYDDDHPVADGSASAGWSLNVVVCVVLAYATSLSLVALLSETLGLKYRERLVNVGPSPGRRFATLGQPPGWVWTASKAVRPSPAPDPRLSQRTIVIVPYAPYLVLQKRHRSPRPAKALLSALGDVMPAHLLDTLARAPAPAEPRGRGRQVGLEARRRRHLAGVLAKGGIGKAPGRWCPDEAALQP